MYLCAVEIRKYLVRQIFLMIRIVQILSGVKIKKIMNIIEPEKKRKRASPVSPLDFMEEARLMWRRDPKVKRSEKSEDRDFREHFGCGVNVAHTIWMMMESRELIPNDGMIHHLLWTLMFLKSYTKEKTMCTLVGIRDPKTLRKWVWLFIDNLAELESSVVSNFKF